MVRSSIAISILAVLLIGCANNAPPPRLGLASDVSILKGGPECGARIFVTMGINHKFPTKEDLRIPRGELYVNGGLIDIVSKNPEVSVIDVPAGTVQLTWMPADYGSFDRGKTKQNPLSVSLANGQIIYASLEYYDDTSDTATLLFGALGTLATVVFRTEVTQASNQTIIGKRIVFHRPLPPGSCMSVQDPASAPVAASPLPARKTVQGEYIVSVPTGAPAFPTERAEGTPIHTFEAGAILRPLEISDDGRWLKVLLPDGRIGFAPAALVRKQH